MSLTLRDPAVGELALDRLEREVEVVTKTVANYHHEVNFLIEAIQREQKRIVEDVTKRVETEIARVLNESEIAATDYVEKRSLWRFLLRMEPISLEATRRLMGGNLVPVANAPGAESGSTIWDGIRSLREVEVLFGHAVGRADGIMSTLASNLRNMLARIAQSKALNRHTLAKELELEMAKVMDLIDNELEGSRGMNPVRTVAQPLAAYEAKVRKEGDHVQATGDKTALATLGFEVGN